MWEVMSYGERPYWDMSNQDVSLLSLLLFSPFLPSAFIFVPRCLLMCFCVIWYMVVRLLLEVFERMSWVVDSCFLREPVWS